MKLPIRLDESDNGLAAQMYSAMKAVCEATFKIVTWSILIATITYFSRKSEDSILAVTAIILQGLLLVYIYTAINRVELNVASVTRIGGRWKVGVDALINLVLTFALFVLANRLMDHFVKTVAELQLEK